MLHFHLISIQSSRSGMPQTFPCLADAEHNAGTNSGRRVCVRGRTSFPRCIMAKSGRGNHRGRTERGCRVCWRPFAGSKMRRSGGIMNLVEAWRKSWGFRPSCLVFCLCVVWVYVSPSYVFILGCVLPFPLFMHTDILYLFHLLPFSSLTMSLFV